MATAKLTSQQVQDYLDAEFPEARKQGYAYRIEETGYGKARMRMHFNADLLRPGGTVSGPAMMSIADFAIYVAILATIGRIGLAVTTNLSINFLNKPGPADIVAEAELLKVGKRLIVGEVRLRSQGSDTIVAHATGTYSVPPR